METVNKLAILLIFIGAILEIGHTILIFLLWFYEFIKKIK
jgi:hypothetical protein